MPKRIHRRRDADPREGVKKYGKATFADPVNKKYPIDTPGRIKAAWAYIHQPVNAGKYSDEEVRTIKVRIRRAAKAEAHSRQHVEGDRPPKETPPRGREAGRLPASVHARGERLGRAENSSWLQAVR